MRLPSHAQLAGETTPPYIQKSPRRLGEQSSPDRLTNNNYREPKSRCLKEAIEARIEDLEDCEKPMNIGIISSQDRQYSKNAVDFHRPWTMTIKGSTPIRSRWVVPPIRKLWPVRVCSPAPLQTSLHLLKNQLLFIGANEPDSVSKVNMWAEEGT